MTVWLFKLTHVDPFPHPRHEIDELVRIAAESGSSFMKLVSRTKKDAAGKGAKRNDILHLAMNDSAGVLTVYAEAKVKRIAHEMAVPSVVAALYPDVSGPEFFIELKDVRAVEPRISPTQLQGQVFVKRIEESEGAGATTK